MAPAVMQVRLNSSRLPAKALLPIAGMPSALLAAKRAANTGREVIIATSTERSDDVLAEMFEQAGFEVFRGDLSDPLRRITDAIGRFDDDSPVIRLTGDNVFPDGTLLDCLEKEFLTREVPYLSCSAEKTGLPYGVSAEITRARHLRSADAAATDPAHREHVTSWVAATFGRHHFTRQTEKDFQLLRCTIDNLDDYLRVWRVFASVEEPVSASVADLIKALADEDHEPVSQRPASRLVLGTAQLGSDYGVANEKGRPDFKEAERIIRTAIRNGVATLDTARAYGDSEHVIGKVLGSGWQGRIETFTKLDLLAECPRDATPEIVASFVDASIFKSCLSLKVDRLDALQLHRAEQKSAWEGAAWDRLKYLRAMDRIGHLGVSVQTPEELAEIIRDPAVTLVQFPFNALDTRWMELEADIISARKERGLIVHTRSVLLQGLLATTNEALWRRANVAAPRTVIDWIKSQTIACGRTGPVDFSLAYARAMPWIDGVVVGAESLKQIHEIIACFSNPVLTEDELKNIDDTRPVLTRETLDPSKWRIN